jgi:hypothetical protein
VSEVVAVGFVPAAPLLVPAVAGGSAHLDGDLREACRSVVRATCEGPADLITVAAAWQTSGIWGADHTWGFEGFGVPRQPPDDRPRLPWPLGIGAWLLDEADCDDERAFVAVGPQSQPSWPTERQRVAVIVVGDGSARRSEKAPGHLDERAASFDASIAAAIREGDVGALAAIDSQLAADLLCAAAPVWRWLHGVIGGQPVVEAQLLADTAPYGVGYFAGLWRLNA